MDFKQIAYFIAIAEKKSFSAAAAHIHVAQPALSTQIANLEMELGCPLFERHARGVTLTPAGGIFLQHAHEISQRINLARAAVRDAEIQPTGSVTLGLPMSTSNILTIPIIERVRERFPKIELCVVDGMSGDIFGWLQEGRLDLAVLYGTGHSQPPMSKPLVNDDLFLLGRSAERKRTTGTEIDFRALSDIPLFISTRSHSLRALLDSEARVRGISLNYVNEIDSIPQLRELVFQRGGYTILPKIALGPDIPKNVQLLRLKNPALQLHSSIALAPHRPPSRAARYVFNLVPALIRYMLKTNQWPGGHLCEAASSSSLARGIPATIAECAVPEFETPSPV